MKKTDRRILFTGASSFTGFWFAKTLAEAGHEVTCLFTRSAPAEYSGIRGLRVARLVATPGVEAMWSANLADASAVTRLLEEGRWDVFCHHAAEVGDYKSPEFNPLVGAQQSIEGVPRLIGGLSKTGCTHFVQSGTYFESGEGVDGESAPAFSPYAVSKSLAAELTRYHAAQAGMRYTHFIMPNPFGPWEDRGFTWYMAGEWLAGRVPTVGTPDYLRDNMPVDLMANCYLDAVDRVDDSAFKRVCPSGFTGRQGDFALFLANGLAETKRLGSCPVNFAQQRVFNEPMNRMNSPEGNLPAWSSSERQRNFWDELSAYYHDYRFTVG